jgi:hypothetical protein
VCWHSKWNGAIINRYFTCINVIHFHYSKPTVGWYTVTCLSTVLNEVGVILEWIFLLVDAMWIMSLIACRLFSLYHANLTPRVTHWHGIQTHLLAAVLTFVCQCQWHVKYYWYVSSHCVNEIDTFFQTQRRFQCLHVMWIWSSGNH